MSSPAGRAPDDSARTVVPWNPGHGAAGGIPVAFVVLVGAAVGDDPLEHAPSASASTQTETTTRTGDTVPTDRFGPKYPAIRSVAMATLAERLGHAPDAKLLIVTCDDLGLTHSANVAVFDAIREGVATSASLMVPCPWSRDAASRYRGEDVGVQLTLNAQFETYRWGPITHAPSLLDGDGGFPRTIEDAWDHADLDEVRREARAQIERAIMWGFDASHVASHLGTLEQRPDFFDVYLELAVEFGLPMRLADPSAERVAGFPFRRLAAEEGAVFPDHVLVCPPGGQRRVERLLFDLTPGVTEVCLHPATDTDEMRAAASDWGGRVEDYAYLSRDPSLREMIARAGARLIGWRALREVQRTG